MLEGTHGPADRVLGCQHQNGGDGRLCAKPGHDIVVAVSDQRNVEESHIEVVAGRKVEGRRRARDGAYVHAQTTEHELHLETLGRIDEQDLLALNGHRHLLMSLRSLSL